MVIGNYMDLNARIAMFITTCIFISGCNEHIENGIAHEIKTDGFINKMAVGEEAVEASLKEMFELREDHSDSDLSKEKSMIDDMGGHLAYRLFLGSATPAEISDKYAEYGIGYSSANNFSLQGED